MLGPVDQRNLTLRRANWLGLLLIGAIPAPEHPTNAAHDADERSARRAGIAFGRALLVSAGAADHCVLLGQFSHRDSPNWRSPGKHLGQKFLQDSADYPDCLRTGAKAGEPPPSMSSYFVVNNKK
jgi:hypothetical protein